MRPPPRYCITVIRQFNLASVSKVLLEKTVTETQSVSGQRYITGYRTVQEAGSKASETAVSEGIILHVFHDGDINALFLQQRLYIIQQAHTVKVVVYQPAHKKLHGKVRSLTAGKTGGFLPGPDRRQCIHGGAGNRVMQFLGGGML